MKKTLLLVVIAITAGFLVNAADRPLAEILDYGIYAGGNNQTIVDTNAPTGLVLQGQGGLQLEKQTTTIPARLGLQFGFRFVVHGKSDEHLNLHVVWLYPEITDKTSGKKSKRFDADCSGKAEDKNSSILWTFTEPSELVPGEWVFQVFQGRDKILEKKFVVKKTDDK
jgi:hypothetical protein